MNIDEQINRAIRRLEDARLDISEGRNGMAYASLEKTMDVLEQLTSQVGSLLAGPGGD